MDPARPQGAEVGLDDVARYRAALAPIEREAAEQPWAEARPWRVDTHVGWEGALPVVDLHGLGAGAARRAVRAVLAEPPAGGAVVLVCGVGRHTLGAGPVLKKVVERELQDGCAAVAAWSYRPSGPARWVWVSDRARAPAAAVGGGSGWAWGLFVLALVAAFVVAVARTVVDGSGWIR